MLDHPAMGQHPQGERIQVRHACPECGPVEKHPLCLLCAGTNLVTTDRLDRWQAEQTWRIA